MRDGATVADAVAEGEAEGETDGTVRATKAQTAGEKVAAVQPLSLNSPVVPSSCTQYSVGLLLGSFQFQALPLELAEEA